MAESYYNIALKNKKGKNICDYIYNLVMAKDSVTDETDPKLAIKINKTSYYDRLTAYKDILPVLLSKLMSNMHKDKGGYMLIAIGHIYDKLNNKGNDQIPFYGSLGFYRAACDKGNVYAMMILGKEYYFENIERSVYYYEKAYYEYKHIDALEELCDMDLKKNKDYEKHITDYYNTGLDKAVIKYVRYMYLKNIEICIESIKKAYTNNPDNIEFLVILGKLLLKQGKFEEGVKYLELANDKGYDAAFAAIGIAYCDKGDLMNAVKYFEKGLNSKEKKLALLYLKLIKYILRGSRCNSVYDCIFDMKFPLRGPHKYINHDEFAAVMSSDCLHRILELDVKRDKLWHKLDPRDIFSKIVLENKKLKEENLHLRYAFGGEGMKEAMNDFYSKANAQNSDETVIEEEKSSKKYEEVEGEVNNEEKYEVSDSEISEESISSCDYSESEISEESEPEPKEEEVIGMSGGMSEHSDIDSESEIEDDSDSEPEPKRNVRPAYIRFTEHFKVKKISEIMAKRKYDTDEDKKSLHAYRCITQNQLWKDAADKKNNLYKIRLECERKYAEDKKN